MGLTANLFKTNSVKFCLLLILFSSSTFSYGQFHQVYHGSDTSDAINGISFYSSNEGYMAFEKFIGYTTDTGYTFTKKYIASNVNYNGYSVNLTFGFYPSGVKAFSKDTLIVYGDYGFEQSILYSVNGGISWLLGYHKNIRLDATYQQLGLTDMQFIDHLTGYIVEGEEILKTTNKGK